MGPQNAFRLSLSGGAANMSSMLKGGGRALTFVGAVLADVEVKTSADTSNCEKCFTTTDATMLCNN